MRKGALPAAVLLLLIAAGAWWFVAESARHGGEVEPRGRQDSAGIGEPVDPETATASESAATRTENRPLPNGDGREHPAAASDSAAVPKSNWIRDQGPSGVEIEVFDAVTRVPLRDVTVESGAEHPGRSTSREPPGGGRHAFAIDLGVGRAPVLRGDSPLWIQLPPRMRRGRMRYLIGAPGHVTVARWFDVSIDGRRRHRIALAPAGQLEVIVRRGEVANEAEGEVRLFEVARLRRLRAEFLEYFYDPLQLARSLASADADVVVPFRIASASDAFHQEIASIASGEWYGLALVEGAAPILAFGRGTVKADGATARIEFELEQAALPPVADFVGCLRFDPGWRAEEVAAVRKLDVLDLFPEIGSPPGEGRFEVELAPTAHPYRLRFDLHCRAGGYAISVPQLGVVFRTVLHGDESAPQKTGYLGIPGEIELVLDAPADAEVRVRDRDGRPRQGVVLRYRAGDVTVDAPFGWVRIATREDGVARLLRMPSGPFEVEVETRIYRSSVARGGRPLLAGKNEIDLVLDGRSGVRLTLLEGAVPTPWLRSTLVDVVAPDDRMWPIDVSGRLEWSGAVCEFELDPGRYVIAPYGFPGFEDPAPFEVVVEEGRVTPVDVVLTEPR